MQYLYQTLAKPTRLYIKQCPHCNLKYFGKSIRKNIEVYIGSGSRWNNHLKKYKVNPIHLWNSNWYYDTSISIFALKFSRINKIVKNDNWANLKEENGLEGGFDHINDGSDAHIKRAKLGGKNAAHNIINKGKMFVANDKRTTELSKLANDIKIKKLKEDLVYKTKYYDKVSSYQKRNNSMKNKCWCIPINCLDKNKEKRVYPIDQIPDGWLSCKDFNQSKKDIKNPAYGKIWIYNEELKQNKYINKTESIPDGWSKGRKMKF